MSKKYEEAIAKDVTLDELKNAFQSFVDVDYKNQRLTIYDLVGRALEDHMFAYTISEAAEQIKVLVELKEAIEDAATIEEFDDAINQAKEDGYNFGRSDNSVGDGFAYMMESESTATNIAAIRMLFIKFFGEENLAMFDAQMKDALGI